MNKVVLMAEDKLLEAEKVWERRPAVEADIRAKGIEDKVCRRGLMRYLMFSNDEIWAASGLTDMDRMYNAYFWFSVFKGASAVLHGYDAGLEQQAFGILERAGDEIEWTIVEALEREAREYVSRRGVTK